MEGDTFKLPVGNTCENKLSAIVSLLLFFFLLSDNRFVEPFSFLVTFRDAEHCVNKIFF